MGLDEITRLKVRGDMFRKIAFNKDKCCTDGGGGPCFDTTQQFVIVILCILYKL